MLSLSALTNVSVTQTAEGRRCPLEMELPWLRVRRALHCIPPPAAMACSRCWIRTAPTSRRRLTGGDLGGSIQTRDQTISGLLTSLDTLANQFGTAFNAAQAKGFDQNGKAGGNFFTVPSTIAGSAAASAWRSQILPQSPPVRTAPPGSNGNLANLSAVQTAALPAGQTPGDAYAGLVFQVGSLAANATAESSATTASLLQLNDQLSSVSGVSIDEESTNLITFQTAYEAAARVVTTIQAMFCSDREPWDTQRRSKQRRARLMTAQRMVTMRVANMVPDMQYNLQQSQQSLAVALQQVTTGLRVNQPSDDPGAAATMTISLASSATVDQYTTNISSVTSQMQTADSSFSSIVTSLNTAVTLGTSGAGATVSTANKQAIATELEGVLSSVVAQGNASYQGVYLFAGSASSTLPLVPASTTYTSLAGTVAAPLTAAYPLTAGSVTSISDASTGKTFVFTATAGETISQLSTAVANAAAAGTLSAGTTATINSTGQLAIGSNSSTDGIVVTTNDPALGAMNATSGYRSREFIRLRRKQHRKQRAGGRFTECRDQRAWSQLFTSGANMIGSLNGLITALQSGTSAQIQTATTAVSTSLNSVTQQRVPLDNSISQLSSQESFLSQETLTLTTQQTALVGVNLATSATNLAQAETANSAVLAAAAKVLPQTLLNYLSQG